MICLRRHPNKKWPALLVLLSATVLCGCEESHGDEHGSPTGSTCPPDSTLTFENFAQPFMQAYCTRCHSSTLMGAARNGAPLGHDFDTEAGILLVAHHIDEFAAAGPDSVNEIMPPSGEKPTLEERKELGEWLACEDEGSHETDGGTADGGHTAHDAGP